MDIIGKCSVAKLFFSYNLVLKKEETFIIPIQISILLLKVMRLSKSFSLEEGQRE